MGSARRSSSEVAQEVARLLDHTGAGDVGPAPPSVERSSASARARRHDSTARAGGVKSAASDKASSAAAAQLIGSASSPLADMNGGGGRARFGHNGATWRLTHGTRPISASRHKAMGFNPEVGRHAPLLETHSAKAECAEQGSDEQH